MPSEPTTKARAVPPVPCSPAGTAVQGAPGRGGGEAGSGVGHFLQEGGGARHAVGLAADLVDGLGQLVDRRAYRLGRLVDLQR